MKTYQAKEKDFDRKTYLVDATGKTLGRLSTKVASILIGKHKPCFSGDQLSGDSVVIVNADKIVVSGKKTQDKIYTHYTGYPSGLKTYNYEELQSRKPEEILMRSISRMLPKNKLGREMLRRLRVYAGPEHQQAAQKPVAMEL